MPTETGATDSDLGLLEARGSAFVLAPVSLSKGLNPCLLKGSSLRLNLHHRHSLTERDFRKSLGLAKRTPQRHVHTVELSMLEEPSVPLPPVAGSDRESNSGQRIRHWEQMRVYPCGAPPPAGHPSRLHRQTPVGVMPPTVASAGRPNGTGPLEEIDISVRLSPACLPPSHDSISDLCVNRRHRQLTLTQHASAHLLFVPFASRRQALHWLDRETLLFNTKAKGTLGSFHYVVVV
ncbi:hypothetical protein EYF80_003009 [Liparis tanakae]|uniref:Uncharacterized protein n=1 Tax=Liparis tanakae TaxID=230148 RepID=A0A4Z2J9C2_9TELE|nr:hypothetical protein EYF80_003009 [Liparis tanakae]